MKTEEMKGNKRLDLRNKELAERGWGG